MKAKSIPFNMRKIEISCNGVVKEYPSESQSHRPISYQTPMNSEALELKKTLWKDLQNGRKLLLNRMTNFVHLFLEIKMSKTKLEEKQAVQKKIVDVNAK